MMRNQIEAIIEACCAGFYETSEGLTDWEKLSEVEPQLADQYRECVRRSIVQMIDSIDRDLLANIGARALHKYGEYATPFEALPEQHHESWRNQSRAIIDAILDSLAEAAG